jgi:hypothetical protein
MALLREAGCASTRPRFAAWQRDDAPFRNGPAVR